MKDYKKVGKYILKEEIGKGNFSSVYLASRVDNQSNDKFAVKCLHKELIQQNQMFWSLLQTEASIMKQIHHANILHCHEFYETTNNYYLIQNYCNKGDLESYMHKHKIKYFREREAINVMKQILSGFKVLRKYDVVHRDLKLSNIFLHESRVLIGDFGMAKVGKDQSGTSLGSPLNMAPELIKGDCKDISKIDLWSIGVVFYQLLYGETPFFALSLCEIYQQIKENNGQNLKFPSQPQVSQEAKNLLRKLLHIDPSQRISWIELFSHEFFQNRKSNQKKHKFDRCKTNIMQEQQKPTKQNSFPLEEGIQVNSKYNNNIKKKDLNMGSRHDQDMVFNQLSKDHQLKESFYRINHEINKVNFLMQISKKVANEIIAHSNQEIKKHLSFILLCSVNIAFQRADKIKKNLIKKLNWLVLQNFEIFCKSDLYELSIDIATQKFQQIQIFMQKMVKNNSIAQLLRQNNVKSVRLENFKEADLLQIIDMNISQIKNAQQFRQSPRDEIDDLLQHIQGISSLKTNEFLNYWNKNEKFDWEDVKFQALKERKMNRNYITQHSLQIN